MAVTPAFQTWPQKRRFGRGSLSDKGLALLDLPKMGAGRRSESGGEPAPAPVVYLVSRYGGLAPE